MHFWNRSVVGVALLSASLLGTACTLLADKGGDVRPSVPPPTHVTAVPGNSQVTVSWQYPPDSIGVVFQVVYSDNSKLKGATCAGDTTVLCRFGCRIQGLGCTLTGLTNGVSYNFSVRAFPPPGSTLESAFLQEDTASATPTAE